MKISVELPEPVVADVCRLTGEPRKGPAIRKLILVALQLRKRMEIAQKFVSGEWSVELDGFEESQAADRAADQAAADAWRKP